MADHFVQDSSNIVQKLRRHGSKLHHVNPDDATVDLTHELNKASPLLETE